MLMCCFSSSQLIMFMQKMTELQDYGKILEVEFEALDELFVTITVALRW